MKFNVGLYLRLSKETSEKQSESIINQKMFLTDYAMKNGFNIVEIFVDDGYTGTNFERPGFKRMLDFIKSGKIDTVITKDLSRLGRDYIETGNYVEKIFPSMGIRYIAVSDGIDTLYDNDFGPFKSVINDMYSKDISKKVKVALTAKRISGEFVGAAPPYGYKRSKNNKNTLVIDDKVSKNVKMIFKLFNGGMSINSIAKKLTSMGIQTPSSYKNLKNKSYKWSDVTVKNILTNQVYVGNMVQHKTQKLSYKLQKRIDVPQEEQILIKNTHCPIVSKALFLKAQKRLHL